MKIGVIAGNAQQFIEYFVDSFKHADDFILSKQSMCGRENGNQHIYISSDRNIRGMKFDKFYFYGTWYERSDIDDLKKEAAANLFGQGKEVPWIK